MIYRLNFRHLAVLFFLIDFVRCDCKNNYPIENNEDNNSPSTSQATTISSNSPLLSALPPSPPTPSPITPDMVNAVQLAPGLQELLQRLQAGENVDVNKVIDTKVDPSLDLPSCDCPLNVVCRALIKGERGAEAVYLQDRLNIIESLLSRGARPNPFMRIERGSYISLVFSVIFNKRLDILKVLLKHKDETFTKPCLYGGCTPYAYVKSNLSPSEQIPFIQAFEAAGITS